ncbi:MAG: peptide chain release factor N(5)-glutamine methyltransferase [Sphingobacteriales bacterium]|nr:MAG: peptide chain release factor N(5)-glutamine methyltransferase [Sphingobacteriales bacterium]
MLSYNKAFYSLKNALQPLYDAQEAAAIAHEVLEHITGLSKMQRLIDKDNLLTDTQQQQYDSMQAALLKGIPMQYVLGHAWFMGRQFMVDDNVLIPRPETEELVQWIIDDHRDKTNLSILDIGTGSGCIPISSQLVLPHATVTSCDISEGALNTARKNATTLGADVNFLQRDILNEREQQQLDTYDIIVSNPPYIPINEKETLHENVRNHEPGLALFVPENDPQLFYREIAKFALNHLKPGGQLYFELHVDYAQETEALLKTMGYTTELRKDMHGNWRMVRGNNFTI